jgi:fumarate reductase flavoprotein subunit
MTDLLIVGGGNAGLAAAAAAGEFGLHCTVVEKASRLGGQLYWSSAHFSAAGTARQRARGIHDHPELHYAEVLRMGHGLGNPELIRVAVEAAPAAVDWLDSMGFPFGDEAPAIIRGHEPYAIPRTYWGGDDLTAGGLPLLETLLRGIESQPARVDVRLDTRMTGLLCQRDPDGSLHIGGIHAETGAGDRLRLEAPVTLLATGGYAANRGLLARLQPGHAAALTGCLPHATGDGLEALMALGVPVTHQDTYCPTMGMIEDPERPGFGLHIFETRVTVNPFDRAPWELWVNRHGERFLAEDEPSPFLREQALRAQPGLAMWVVFDQQVLEQAPPLLGPRGTPEKMRQAIAEGRIVRRADSLAGLAEATGLPGDALCRSVTDYNAALAGSDPMGRRHRPVGLSRAPWYAAKVTGGMLLSRGGPMVDRLLRPLCADGRPIAGCLVAGELLGMGQFSGDSFAGGMSVGPALALGRLAAARAAAWRADA